MRTIKSLRALDVGTATLFRKLCSCCVSVRVGHSIIDARVPSLGGNAGSNSLRSYGLSFDNLNILNEYGLIIADYNSYYDYRMCIMKNRSLGLPLTHQGGLWGLAVPEPVEGDASPANKELRITGVALSQVGKELLPIVDIDPAETYTDALAKFFTTQKLTLTRIDIQNS